MSKQRKVKAVYVQSKCRTNDCYDPCEKPRCNTIVNPEAMGFYAMIMPATNVVSGSSTNGQVLFTMRRRNKIVTLSWQLFSCQVSGVGVSFLAVNQSIANLPQTAEDFPIRISYIGTYKVSFIRIDPSAVTPIQFYLDISGSGISANGDAVIIPSSTISWITE